MVVLAAGRGTRLAASDASRLDTEAQRAVAARGLKVMMPVGADGRRWIDYALDGLAYAGCRDAVLVVPPEHGDLRLHLERTPRPAVRIRYAVQAKADGTAGAVQAAAAAVETPWFLVVNGDTLYPADAVTAAAAIDGCGLAAFTRHSLLHQSGLPMAKVAAFAVVECDATGGLTGLREKPTAARLASLGPEVLVSVNLWKMSQAIFEACRDVVPSARGERELPDAVMLAVARGTPFHAISVTGRLFDLTTADDVAIASRGLVPAGPGS